MTFPDEPLSVAVELGEIVTPGVWTDVTGDVYVRDGIHISRGRSDEAAQTAPQTCTLTFNNRDGKYSARNPTGPYFGKLGRNTLLRVSVYEEPVWAGSSISGSGAGNLSWTHTPTVSQPSGVFVWIQQATTIGDQVTSVTYGGVPMVDKGTLGTNPAGTYYRWELTGVKNIPAGAHTVLVSVSGAATKRAVAFTVSGGEEAVMAASGAFTSTSANPSVAITAAHRAILCGYVYSDHDTIAQVTAGAGFTEMQDTDFGTEVWSPIRGNAVVDAGAHNVAWTSASSTWTGEAFAVECRSIRFLGEVSEWPPRWDVSGKDAFVPITASGIMRRLGQGRPPLISGLKAYVISEDPNNYWPLDEGELAGYGRNASSNSSFRFYPWPSSGPNKPLIKFGTGELSQDLPNGLLITRTNTGGATYPYLRGDVAMLGDEVTVDYVFRHIGETPAEFRLHVRDYNNNTWRIAMRSGAFDDIQLAHIDTSTDVTTGLVDTSPLPELTDGELHHVRFSMAQNGADVDLNAYVDGVAVAGATRTNTTMNGCAIVYVTYEPTGTETPIALGHVVVWAATTSTAPDAYSAMIGYVGETAGNRMDRVLGGALIQFIGVGDLAGTIAMGPQIEGDVLAQVRDAAATDLGSLYEPRDTLGVAYRTRGAAYNQTPALTIDYTAGELSPPFEPVDDDQLTRNDVTATKSGGGSARQTLTTGRMSTQAPPAGVGPYEDEVTVNVASDGQLDDVAGWLLHVGTWDESRYPVVRVERAAPAVAGHVTLTAALLDVDIDDMIAITNLDSVGVYEDVRLLVRGYTETLAPFSHVFELNCTPAGPYKTGVWNSAVATTGSRWQPGAIRTWEGLDATETQIDTLIDSGGLLFDNNAPYDIVIGGERMTVTAVNTETIQFVSNGAVADGNNVSLNPGLPPFVQNGDLVLIYASIRSSGTGTPNTPTGWTSLLDMSNAVVYGRLYDGVWTMPTVTFTGGVTGDDTIAQACSFRGLSIGAFSTDQLNGSAQNIATPFFGSTGAEGRIVIWAGWKQDDWTSVNNIDHPGAVLIQSRFSIAGNDAAQVWSYKLITNPHESIPSRTFVVGGGAAAISRGGVLMLWPGQRLTVTRSVNGVVKSHASGATVEMYEPARYAL